MDEKLNMQELETMFKSVLETRIKELGLDEIDRKHKIFSVEDEKNYASTSEKQRLKDFVKSVFMKDRNAMSKVYNSFGMEKALSEGTTTAGGFLVPDQFRTQVIHVAEIYGKARQEANVFGFSGDTLYLTTDNGVVSVAWTAENNPIPHSQPVFAQPSISIKKLAGITAMSNELLADAQFDIVAYLAQLFGEQIAYKEDLAFFTGDGTSTYGSITGLTNFASTSVQTMTSTSIADITAQDINNLVFKVPTKYRSGAKLYMHPTIFSYIKTNQATTGEYIIVDPTNPNQNPKMFGYDVVEVEAMPTSDAANSPYVGFSNMRRHCYFADRQSMGIAIGTEGTVNSDNLFEKDMSAVRVTERIGGTWVLETGVGLLKTKA